MPDIDIRTPGPSLFALPEDQLAIRDMALSFAAERLKPHALEWDEQKHFPVDVMREAAALGIGGIYIREDVGSSGLSRLDAALIFEALAPGAPPFRPPSPCIICAPTWWTATAPRHSGGPGCRACTRWTPSPATA